MGHVSRPTLYKYLITKVARVLQYRQYGNLMHRNYYRFRIQIISYANTGLYLYQMRGILKSYASIALFCKLPRPFQSAHMHIICKLKHAISIKIGVRCYYHLYVRAVCRFIMGEEGVGVWLCKIPNILRGVSVCNWTCVLHTGSNSIARDLRFSSTLLTESQNM